MPTKKEDLQAPGFVKCSPSILVGLPPLTPWPFRCFFQPPTSHLGTSHAFSHRRFHSTPLSSSTRQTPRTHLGRRTHPDCRVVWQYFLCHSQLNILVPCRLGGLTFMFQYPLHFVDPRLRTTTRMRMNVNGIVLKTYTFTQATTATQPPCTLHQVPTTAGPFHRRRHPPSPSNKCTDTSNTTHSYVRLPEETAHQERRITGTGSCQAFHDRPWSASLHSPGVHSVVSSNHQPTTLVRHMPSPTVVFTTICCCLDLPPNTKDTSWPPNTPDQRIGRQSLPTQHLGPTS